MGDVVDITGRLIAERDEAVGEITLTVRYDAQGRYCSARLDAMPETSPNMLRWAASVASSAIDDLRIDAATAMPDDDDVMVIFQTRRDGSGQLWSQQEMAGQQDAEWAMGQLAAAIEAAPQHFADDA